MTRGKGKIFLQYGVSLGNYNYHDFEGAVNIQIVKGKVALRVAGKISRRDGYTENLGVGRDMDDIKQDNGRISTA